MREITQIEKFNVRRSKVARALKNIIKSDKARKILVENDQGRVLLEISPDLSFVQPTLDLVSGIGETIKNFKLVVIKKQLLLFNH